jgi:hypothetical protein
VFELALGHTNYRDADEINASTFLPFGKSVAFRKSAWEAVAGYPEWATHCEDVLYDVALKRAGMRFAFVAEAIVHFQPRSTLQQFAASVLYARGDAVAGLWPRRHAIRYAVYLWGLTCSCWVAAGLAPIVLGMGAYCVRPVDNGYGAAFTRGSTAGKLVLAMTLVPFARGRRWCQNGRVCGWLGPTRTTPAYSS